MVHHLRNAYQSRRDQGTKYEQNVKFAIPEMMQEITQKKPPGWDPQYNQEYSYEKWFQDMTHWIASTDIPREKQGSTVVLRLGGLAREFANDLDPLLIKDGGNFAIGGENVQLGGVAYRMWQLGDQFEALQIETELAAMLRYQSFRRFNGEPIESLSRFELYRRQARDDAKFSMGIQ